MFKANIGSTDRIIRLVLGLALAALGIIAFSGLVQIILIVLGVVAIFTATTGFCLLYRIFGINTCKNPKV